MNQLFEHFYPEDTPLRRLLLRHSEAVRDKALRLLQETAWGRLGLDPEQVSTAAMLHDIGVSRCHAPSILCEGTEPYLQHGLIGAGMLRSLAAETGQDLEPYARVCERHTGSGLTAAEILAKNLPLPAQDFLPETPLEKLICYADKFFSKSKDGQELSWETILTKSRRFGPDVIARLEALHAICVTGNPDW